MTEAHADEYLARHIERLVSYALHRGLIETADIDAARNALLDLFGLVEGAANGADSHSAAVVDEAWQDGPAALLEPLLEAALQRGLIPEDTATSRDLFDARIMGILMPRPSETLRLFRAISERENIASATDWFYQLNIDANYIRMDRIRLNDEWRQITDAGELEITINLSKPEKDPREIARLKTLPAARYPKCVLCKENVGYAGRPDHPARQNLRTIPLSLQGETWHFQYSPYVYYNEHSIVFRDEHVPMQISAATFARLLDFVDQFPHYFVGSNADLPIVGGSILSHDHFQAGRHRFPMALANVSDWFSIAGESKVYGGVVCWPMSVLRLRSPDRHALLRVCESVLACWRNYSDPLVDIVAYTDGTPHNTITPIARLRDEGEYEMDLVLRNNRTNTEFPDGIFHPHPERHHVKKENIGLIEVMGLAVLPGRLQQEMAAICAVLSGEVRLEPEALTASDHPLHKHAEWVAALVANYGTACPLSKAKQIVRNAVGDKFVDVLRDCGVFKQDERGREAFRRFLGRCR